MMPKSRLERLGHVTQDLYAHVMADMQGDGAMKVDRTLKIALGKRLET
jgi:hypothetical protein